MQIPRFLWFVLSGLAVTGCSTLNDVGEAIPDALGRTSLMYRINVQQGNVLEQSKVNQLEPGMSKSQVRYIMGSPLLVDVFHQDRWDYYYSIGKGKKVLERKRIALFFEDDRLVRLEGDMKPVPLDEITDFKEARVYSVPDYDKRTGLFGGMMRMMESDESEDSSNSETPIHGDTSEERSMEAMGQAETLE